MNNFRFLSYSLDEEERMGLDIKSIVDPLQSGWRFLFAALITSKRVELKLGFTIVSSLPLSVSVSFLLS